jgi:hypothetical protein
MSSPPHHHHPRANYPSTVATQGAIIIYASARNIIFVHLNPYKIKQVMGLPSPANNVVAQRDGDTVLASYNDKIAVYTKQSGSREDCSDGSQTSKVETYTRTATIQTPDKIQTMHYHENRQILVVATIRELIVYQYSIQDNKSAGNGRRSLTSHMHKHTISENSLPPPSSHQNTLQRIQALQLNRLHGVEPSKSPRDNRILNNPRKHDVTTKEWKILWQKP